MADGFQPKFVDLVRNTTSTVGTAEPIRRVESASGGCGPG